MAPASPHLGTDFEPDSATDSELTAKDRVKDSNSLGGFLFDQGQSTRNRCRTWRMLEPKRAPRKERRKVCPIARLDDFRNLFGGSGFPGEGPYKINPVQRIASELQ